MAGSTWVRSCGLSVRLPGRPRLRPRHGLSLAALAVALAAGTPAQATTFTVTDQAEFDAAIIGATAPGSHVIDINDPLAVTPNPYDPTVLLTRNPSLTLPGAASALVVNLDESTLYFGTDASGGTLRVRPGTTINLVSDQRDSGLWVAVGAGAVGAIDIRGGAINITAGDAIPLFGVGINGGTGTGTMTGGTITVASGSGTGFAVIDVGDAGTGTFTQSGGSVTANGPTALLIGVIGGEGTYNLRGGATFSLGDGSTIYIGDDIGGDGTLHVSGDASFSIDGAATQAYIGNGAGAGTIIQDGAGSTVTLDVGLVAQFGSAVDTGNGGGTGTYELSAGTLQIGRNGASFGTVADGVGIFEQSGGTFETIGGSALLRIGDAGQGTWTLSGGKADLAGGLSIAVSAGSTGTVTQTGGTLTISGGVVAFGAGTGTYDLNGGTLEVGGAGGITGAGAFNLGGGTVRVIGSALTTAVPATLATGTSSTIDTNGFGATFTGALSGQGALVKTGAGTLVLTGPNSYQGGTTLRAGTIAIGHATALGTGALIFAGNGTLQLDAALTVANLIGVDSGVIAKLDSGSFTSTLSGAISGAGSIVKQGTGQITLGTINSYTGGTRVDDGTLVAGVFGAFVGNTPYLINGGTLDLNDFSLVMSELSGTGGTVDLGTATLEVAQETDTTFAGAIVGSGNFTKSGDGTLILTGTSTYGGTTVINGGSLIVNGSITSAVTVAAGGLLGGNGSVGAVTVAFGGALSPGSSIDTIDVNGPLTFDPGSIYVVEIDDQGNSDLTAATGAVTINGGTLVVDTSAGYVLDTPYTIISGSSIAGPGFVSVSQGFVFLDVDVDYGVADPNEVQMTLSRNGLSFGAIGDTPNQEAVGGGVESLGPGNALYDAVVVLTDVGEVRDAFDQLTGEIHPSIQTALLDDSRFVRDAIMGRLTGAPGTSAAPVAATPTTAWLKAYGSWATLDGTDAVAGLDRSIGGVFIGLDRALDETWTVGLVGGYAHSEIDVDDRASSASVDTYQIAAYGGARFGAIGLRLGAGYAWHDIDTARSVDFTGFSDRLDASYGAGTAQVFAEAGYRVDLTPAAIEPFAGIAYVNVDSDGFSEDGGAAALDADGSGNDATFTTLGVRASADLGVEGGTKVALRGMVAWRHAFADTPEQTFAFDGGDDFVIEGLPLAEDTVVLELGVGVDIAPGITAGLSYSGQVGDGLSDHGVNATVGFGF